MKTISEAKVYSMIHIGEFYHYSTSCLEISTYCGFQFLLPFLLADICRHIVLVGELNTELVLFVITIELFNIIVTNFKKLNFYIDYICILCCH